MSATAMVEIPMNNLVQVRVRPAVTDTITLGDSFGQVSFADQYDAPVIENVKSIPISQARQEAKIDGDLANFESTATLFAFTSVLGDKLFSQVNVYPDADSKRLLV
jgi:hypothetical protein